MARECRRGLWSVLSDDDADHPLLRLGRARRARRDVPTTGEFPARCRHWPISAVTDADRLSCLLGTFSPSLTFDPDGQVMLVLRMLSPFRQEIVSMCSVDSRTALSLFPIVAAVIVGPALAQTDSAALRDAVTPEAIRTHQEALADIAAAGRWQPRLRHSRL